MFERSISNTRIQPTFGVERRAVLAAGVFLMLFYLFEGSYFGTGLPQFIDSIRLNDDISYAFIAGIYFLLDLYLVYLFILFIFAARWPFKVLGIGFFAFVTCAEYSYRQALGRFTIPFDINSAITATSDQKFDSFLSFISFLWLIPTAVLVIFAILFSVRSNHITRRKVLTWVAFCTLFYAHLFFITPLFFGDQLATSSLDAFSQTTITYLLKQPAEIIHAPKRQVVDQSVDTEHKPINNIVLVFDESIRSDHLSLNGYSRKTTPFLDDLAKKHLLINWGTASSTSTSSQPSFDYFLSGALPQTIEQITYEQVNLMPSIFQYAKAMNYKTYMLDGQMKNYWGGIPDDQHYIDQLFNMSDLDHSHREDWQNKDGQITYLTDENDNLKQWEIDPKLAAMVNEIFSRSAGNFILVYKRGAHFPYEKNYPAGETEWSPIYRFKSWWEIPPREKRNELMNSYDNAIRYNVDAFFRALANDYSNLPNNTVILYTSDHGEAFYGNGQAEHGGSSPEEATVPLFVLGLNDRTIDTTFKASHANLFTTLLDLMRVPDEKRKYPYAISLLKATKGDSTSRYFNLANGKKVLFD